MTEGQIDVRNSLRKALGATRPPEKITQEAYEYDTRHLQNLVRLEPGQQADRHDLFAYVEDLRWTAIQSSLFAYLLPICLEMWRNDVCRIHTGYGGVVENFYPVLADRNVFEVHLTPKQTSVVSNFMRQTILEEIDDQRGLSFQGKGARPYRWIGELTTYGIFLPDAERLWAEWWSLNTIGRAVAAIQYISCLMYSENENPVFAPWTPNGGGGPPGLWHFEGHLYEHRWLESNVAFLKQALSVETVGKLLSRALSRLVGEPEYAVAAAVREDFPLCEATVATRCAVLPRILETTRVPGELPDWPR